MCSGSVWFCCLVWTTTIQFTMLALKVKQAADNGYYEKGNNWSNKIDKWRRQNYLISELVDKISHFYGPFLFVLVTYSFIVMINSSFLVLTNLLGEQNKANDITIYLVIFLIQLLIFAFVVYVPHRLRESVSVKN